MAKGRVALAWRAMVTMVAWLRPRTAGREVEWFGHAFCVVSMGVVGRGSDVV
jgi:hypothetical protein